MFGTIVYVLTVIFFIYVIREYILAKFEELYEEDEHITGLYLLDDDDFYH